MTGARGRGVEIDAGPTAGAPLDQGDPLNRLGATMDSLQGFPRLTRSRTPYPGHTFARQRVPSIGLRCSLQRAPSSPASKTPPRGRCCGGEDSAHREAGSPPDDVYEGMDGAVMLPSGAP